MTIGCIVLLVLNIVTYGDQVDAYVDVANIGLGFVLTISITFVALLAYDKYLEARTIRMYEELP